MKVRILKSKLKAFGSVKHYKEFKCVVLKTQHYIYCFCLETKCCERKKLDFDKKNATIGEAFESRLLLNFNQAFKELNNLASYSWLKDVLGGVLKNKHNNDNAYYYHGKIKSLSYAYNL